MKSRRTVVLACVVLTAVAGCAAAKGGDKSSPSAPAEPATTPQQAAEDVTPSEGQAPAAELDTAMGPEQSTDFATASAPKAGAAGVEAAPPQAASEAEGASASDSTSAAPTHLGRASLGSSALPCELNAVLETSCQGCHARNPGALAPMALTSREDLLAPSISQPERKVYELMTERIHSVDSPMPPASSRKLTSEELAALDKLLGPEIAVGPEQCGGASAKRADYPPPDPSEIEQCYPFHAYASSGDFTKPFRVPNGENYACFAFDIPWPGEAQALSVRVRASPLVHHWRLFDQQLDVPQGTVLVSPTDCSFGTFTTYAVVEVSDTKEINMPPTVGLELPTPGTGLKMMLSVHYFNTGEAIDDMSGAEVCVARKPREHTAGIHSTSNSSFTLPPRQATEVTVQCSPKYAGDIHILQSLPHMHKRGTRLSTVVQRANGMNETLIDVPFDFNNQIQYQTDMVLKPGDKLLTTCHFQNDSDRTVVVGPSTDDEMCLNDITAWPAGSLVNGNSVAAGKGCYE